MGGGLASKPAQALAKKTSSAISKATSKSTTTTLSQSSKPQEPYNRRNHYGNTPKKSDRTALKVKPDEVVDHDPPLVKRYYEGDPKISEKPGYKMTSAERRASANDRTRMAPQKKTDSNKQGGEMSQYSKQKKKEHDL